MSTALGERGRSAGEMGTVWWPSPRAGLRLGRHLALLGFLLLVAAPVLGVLRYLPGGGDGLFAHLAETVLWDYARNTALICVGVAILTGLAGTGTAWLVTLYTFPGRSWLSWALVLPLAMPAYVLAYAYTDLLQVTGPVQTWLRAMTGWGVRDYAFPEIHSVAGAVFVLSAVLYPYVYVLARAAFAEQSQCALDVSRTLGCNPLMAFYRVGLPLARPAIATGVALAVMEAVADFGAVSFFGVPTFTTGIYRAWYALGSAPAAGQLASLLLLLVFTVLTMERLLRGRAQFASNTTHIFPKSPQRLTPLAAALATAACSLPVFLGFALPVVALALMALGAEHGAGAMRLLEVTWNTALLGGMGALVIVTAALIVLVIAGPKPTLPAGILVRAASLGYATPGAVIGVGIVVVVGGFDARLDELTRLLVGDGTGLVLGGSVAALLYGYLARFFAVAYTPLEAGFAKIGPAVGDAARVLGSAPVAVFRRVHLPLLRPALLSAMLLVFVDVMKELPATMILRPFDFDTLAVQAYRLATTERLAEAALPSFIIVVAGLLPVVWLCRLLARGRLRDLGGA